MQQKGEQNLPLISLYVLLPSDHASNMYQTLRFGSNVFNKISNNNGVMQVTRNAILHKTHFFEFGLLY